MTLIESQEPHTLDQPGFRLRASMNGMGEAPGKVWFFELAAAVIDADRCIQCGACIAACPSDSLAISKEDLPYLVKMCTGCSLCWDYCPRGGLRYEATWPEENESANQESSTDELPSVITGAPGQGLGVVREQLAARVTPDSKLHSEHSQDGGLVSALLIAALEAGDIDAALLAQPHPSTPWRAVPFLATTAEEIRDCAGSFYNQTLALGALDLERFGLFGDDHRIAVVGTPCEIQGIRALQRSSWRKGFSRVDLVVLSIAVMCTKSFDYRKLMLKMIQGERKVQLSNVAKVDVIHGRLLVYGTKGEVLVDEPVKNFHSAALKGCDECADFLGRAADLSIGSVGSAEGFSSVLVRTEAGAQALRRVEHGIETIELERPEALNKLDALDKRIAFSSLQRPFDPDGPLFIDFAEHLEHYNDTDRAPVWSGR